MSSKVHSAKQKFPWGLNDKTHPKKEKLSPIKETPTEELSLMDENPPITYKGKPHEDPYVTKTRENKANQKTIETILKERLEKKSGPKGGKQKSRRNRTRKNKRSRKNRH